MPCYGPRTGYRSKEVNASGRRSIVWNILDAHSPFPIAIPCGQCVGCRLEHSRQWAMRCLHEKKLHSRSCFITLTYDNDHLPEGGSLVKRDLQLFMKRLRKITGPALRFYACGEYGDVGSRPHYHVLLFNYDFADRKVFSGRNSKHPVSLSRQLDAIWSVDGVPIGLAVVGDVTFESCAYVARYIMKKVTGDRSDDHYLRLDADGRPYRLLPEFTVMSRRPGIGTGWFKRFGEEVAVHDSVLINGHEVRPPRFYDSLMELTDPDRLAINKSVRRHRAIMNKADNTGGIHGRLHVKKRIADGMLARKERKL